ncbi:MAG: hypothetical protein HC843_09430 [Sphingomonadales bacterium]|nr:hypothetical protein [Sphingomonadales bacterium]
MIWGTILFGALTAIAVAGLAYDEVRARLTRPAGQSPLAGMKLGDIIMISLYVVPIFFASIAAIRFVLT